MNGGKKGITRSNTSFSPAEPNPLYMAAIALENNARLVTLTTQPTEQCAPYHRRMPALIAAPDIRDWLAGSSCHAERLLGQPYDKLLKNSLTLALSNQTQSKSH
ncbi:hypothetical protein QW180_23335 [Vibrio sinaloensis]|nr:hypothetical protein [Vibrio sinaloensis]